MAVDVSKTIAGLDALASRLDEATKNIVAGAAHVFQQKAMSNAPVGREGNSTNAPGDLKRSITVEGPVGSDGSYRATVGPTVITAHPGPGGTIYNYGRQREFGGEITPRVTPYLAFQVDGTWYRKASVFQHGSFYLTRSRDEGAAEIEAVMTAELTAAVEG